MSIPLGGISEEQGGEFNEEESEMPAEEDEPSAESMIDQEEGGTATEEAAAESANKPLKAVKKESFQVNYSFEAEIQFLPPLALRAGFIFCRISFLI